VLTYKDKVLYEGEWKNDVKCGKGTLFFFNSKEPIIIPMVGSMKENGVTIKGIKKVNRDDS